MYIVSVGGMKMRGWSVFFRIIPMTYKALRVARKTDGCVHADIFRDGRNYFTFSVWTNKTAMKTYAAQGIHGEMMRSQVAQLVDFVNHSFESDTIPTRKEAQAMWQSLEG